MKPRAVVTVEEYRREQLQLWAALAAFFVMVLVGVAMNCDWWPL